MRRVMMLSGLTVLLVGSAAVVFGQPAPGGQRTDFALFDGTDAQHPEAGAQCGARAGNSSNAIAFTYHVTVSNWSASTKVLKVLYADSVENARYQIPPGTSFNLSQAAGGTVGVDDFIRVFAEEPLPSGLAGSMSISTGAAAQPHPANPASLCTTLTTAP